MTVSPERVLQAKAALERANLLKALELSEKTLSRLPAIAHEVSAGELVDSKGMLQLSAEPAWELAGICRRQGIFGSLRPRAECLVVEGRDGDDCPDCGASVR